MTHQSIRWKIQEANFLFEKILWLFSPYYASNDYRLLSLTHAAIIVYVVIHLLVPENLQQQQSIRPSQMKKYYLFFQQKLPVIFVLFKNSHLSFRFVFFSRKKLLEGEWTWHSFIHCVLHKQANQPTN